MSKKITLSELRTFIQKKAIKMYSIHILEERKAEIKKQLNELEMVQKADNEIDGEVYYAIEARMRPTDTTLSFDELQDIANEYGLNVEDVANIMVKYVANRDLEKSKELENDIKDVINYDFNDNPPDFQTFYATFNNYDDFKQYNVSQVKNIYTKLTTDPNQLSLFERKIK